MDGLWYAQMHQFAQPSAELCELLQELAYTNHTPINDEGSQCMEIINLMPQHKKRAARVVADAFFDYPSFIHYFPDIKRRIRWLVWYMECVIKSALTYGEAWVTEDFSGVLLFLPPSHTRLSDWDFVRCGFLILPLAIGLRRYPGVDECENHVADAHEKLLAGRPHYYLWSLTVDPTKQRTGSGKALLDSFLAKTDSESLPVYLETHKQENVTYYERYGFKCILAETIPKHNLKFWCLLREPGGV